MRLVVGLGNPGEKYRNTRHNVGFLLVERLKEENLAGVRLFQPDIFMNRSGVAVKEIMDNGKWKMENLYIAHDDLDIKLGEYKIVFGKGPRVHNGLKSIYEQLGTKDFWHVRLGIDNRQETMFKGTGEEYVLGKWLRGEKQIVMQTIEKSVSELLGSYL